MNPYLTFFLDNINVIPWPESYMYSFVDKNQIPSHYKSFWLKENSDFENSLSDTETLQVFLIHS